MGLGVEGGEKSGNKKRERKYILPKTMGTRKLSSLFLLDTLSLN